MLRRPFFLVMFMLLLCAGLANGDELNRPIADNLVFQHAGNLGLVSAGVGWRTGARSEIYLLGGYAPESLEGIDIYVAGAKANLLFKPLVSNEQATTRLYSGIGFLYYFGSRYTTYDYPQGYYTYPSHEWHLMPYLGIKLISNEPAQRGVSLYAEAGIIDAYLIHYYNNYKTLRLEDAINFSVGLSIPLR